LNSKIAGRVIWDQAVPHLHERPIEKRLAPGTVLGRRLRGCQVAGFILTEAYFPANAVLPAHCHENGFFRLITAGVSTDISGGKRFLGEAASMVYHAAAESHANVWHRAGRSFIIELPADATDRVGEGPTRILERGQTFPSGPTVHTALRVLREFQHMDSLSPLALEGLILELLAVACRCAGLIRRPHPPAWLRRAKELLDDCPTKAHRLRAVAAAAGVHPGHLARAFRNHYDCTLGDYLRRLRVERACRLLRGNAPVAEIALAAGFADQSHFSAVFKRHMGMTPAVYRTIFD
jgi:AraC family transcriptional regulator